MISLICGTKTNKQIKTKQTNHTNQAHRYKNQLVVAGGKGQGLAK